MKKWHMKKCAYETRMEVLQMMTVYSSIKAHI